jgi:ATP-dependent DNA helicase RecQ
MSNSLEILKKYWNYDSFRHPQEEIILSVINKKDTIALLPTGGGKSICFQIPILLKEGICIVVSPLIALMNDQVNSLIRKGIKAVALTSKLSENEIVNIFDNLQFGGFKFLYLSPEKLQSEFIKEKLRHINIQLIAVDEAHCISEWGHDFRPAYLNIHLIRELHPDIPIIALTASATEKVTNDIVTNLKLNNTSIIKKSFYRKNLAYQIFTVEDKLFRLQQILNKVKGPKIIYTNTRKKTVEISTQLNQLNFNTTFYHGGMTMDEKIKSYEDWMSESKPIIVATNAFGMGIDKSNVRAVIHINLPQSIENYMQEAGRGGRDGKKAFSIVLKNENDTYDLIKITKASIAPVKFIKEVYLKLNQYFHISYGELSHENFEFNLSDFCKVYKLPIVVTYNSLKTLDHESIILLDESYNRKSTVKFIISNNKVFEYLENNKSKKKLIQLLLRTYGGIFESNKIINENYVANTLGYSQLELKNILKSLHKDAVITYYNANNNAIIRFLVPREDSITINVITKSIDQRNTLKLQKVTSLIRFIENKKSCRSIQLLDYFDEKNIKECGICDICINQKSKNQKQNKNDIPELIITFLNENSEQSSQEIVSALGLKEEDVLFSLQLLLEKNILNVTSHNKYKLSKD